MIYIRTDANEKIATGHVMRCMSIAKALVRQGESVTFITSDEYPKEILENNGFEVKVLENCYDRLEDELEVLCKYLQHEQSKKVLVDSYYATENYLAELRKFVKVIYIDDLGKLIYPSDLLINYCNYYQNYNYEKRYKEIKNRLLLGCRYVPLRDEFCNNKRVFHDKISNILVTTGGTDTYNMGYLIGKKLVENLLSDNIKIQIVSGRFNKNLDSLYALEKAYQQITIICNTNNMAELMMDCDIAVSAGGTTLYELCYCGAPTVCFAFADNQLDGTKTFGNENIMVNIGDIREDICGKVDEICDAVWNLAKNKDIRKSYSQRQRSLVDGDGANNIAKEIIDL